LYLFSPCCLGSWSRSCSCWPSTPTQVLVVAMVEPTWLGSARFVGGLCRRHVRANIGPFDLALVRSAHCWALSTLRWVSGPPAGAFGPPLGRANIRWDVRPHVWAFRLCVGLGRMCWCWYRGAGDVAHQPPHCRTCQPNSCGCECPCWHARKRLSGVGWQVPARVSRLG